MKFPKLCAVRLSLYFLSCLFTTPLFCQIATPTFESSHGSGEIITLCEGEPLSFFVTEVPSNAFFRFYRTPEGGSPQQITVGDPSLAQITTTEHALNDRFYAEVIYSQNGVTSMTLTTSITVNYFPSPMGLTLSTNLANRFYCTDTEVEITANGADFYLFFLDGIAQGASSTLATLAPDYLRGETVVTVEGYNLFGCSNSVSITLMEVDLNPGLISGSQVIGINEFPIPLSNVTHASLGTATFDTITTGIYQWESSFDGVEWFEVLNANEADFTPSLITTNTFFRRNARSTALGDLCSIASNEVLIELDLSTEFSCEDNPIVFSGSRLYNVDPCSGFTAISVTSSDISGGQAFMVNNQPMYSLEWAFTPEDSNETIIYNGYTIAQAFPGEYRLTINDEMECSLAQNDSVLIRVQAVPTQPFDVQGAFISATGEPTKIQYNECVIDSQNVGNIGLIVNAGTPPFEVKWYHRSNNLQSFQELAHYANQYVLSNLAEGEYKVTIQTTTASSCLPSDENYAHYNYEEIFNLSAGLPQFTTEQIYTPDLSQNGIGNFQIGVIDMPDTATFYLNERPVEIVAVDAEIYTLRIETTLTQAELEIRSDNNCILSTQPLDITVTQPHFTYSSLSSNLSSIIPIREEVNFINHTTDNYTHVIWHFGDGESTEQLPRSDLAAHSIFHRYLLAGNYQVRLELFNGRGCSRSTSQTITIGEGYHIIFPNAFTPNQDQINDVFRPILSGFSEVNFAVYDQSWTLLYVEKKTDSTPPQGILLDGWNGSNAPTAATNFIYTLHGTLLDQTTKIERSGTFIALR